MDFGAIVICGEFFFGFFGLGGGVRGSAARVTCGFMFFFRGGGGRGGGLFLLFFSFAFAPPRAPFSVCSYARKEARRRGTVPPPAVQGRQGLGRARRGANNGIISAAPVVKFFCLMIVGK